MLINYTIILHQTFLFVNNIFYQSFTAYYSRNKKASYTLGDTNTSNTDPILTISNGAAVTLVDSDGEGSVDGYYGDATYTSSGWHYTGNGIVIESGSTLYVESGTYGCDFYCDNGTLVLKDGEYGGMILSTGSDSAVTIDGGTINVYDGSFAACVWTVDDSNTKSVINISGGTSPMKQHRRTPGNRRQITIPEKGLRNDAAERKK